MIPPPPKLSDLRAGTRLIAGRSTATVIPDIDFETYSAAGFIWDVGENRWTCLPHAAAGKKGLPVVGAARYSEHPSTEILCMAYDLKDGRGRRSWTPRDHLFPDDLYLHILNGGLLEAWNVEFEAYIWENVAVPRLGWPPVARGQWRCAMAKARFFSLPGKLEKAAEVLGTSAQKDKDGTRLINLFSVPRNPTKADPRLRINPLEDPVDGPKLYAYNVQDIAAEAEVSSLIPDLEGEELEFWQRRLEINMRGVQIDMRAVTACSSILEQALTRYNRELFDITGGAVSSASEIQKLLGWLSAQNVVTGSLDEDHIVELLAREDLTPLVRRAVEIRALVGSASVKKLFSLANTVCSDGRLRGAYTYSGARTHRVTGNGPQPTNLPASGPDMMLCACCSRHYGTHRTDCPWCGADGMHASKQEWGSISVCCGHCGVYRSDQTHDCPNCGATHIRPGRSGAEDVFDVLYTGSLSCVEMFFGDAMKTISGSLRGTFIAAPGHDLICSDYSAIEAVVIAELAGESWRQAVFRTHGRIYEMSASKISGVSIEEMLEYKHETGKHHPLRKKGKIAELALGYGGFDGALRAFGAAEFMTDEEMIETAKAWRKASPAIVEFWGGQQRNWRPEMFGIEGMVVSAVLSPGRGFEFRGHMAIVERDVLYLRLVSGSYLTYHNPRLRPSDRRRGDLSLSYMGWNTNPKSGPQGWVQIDTYGPKIVENIVQSTARDIQRHAIVNQERAGYRIVLDTYDENVAEVPEGFGSLEEFERIMSTMPAWAAGWPVKATGGWRGKRYRK